LCPDIDFGCPALNAVFQEFNSRIMEAATNESLPAELRLPNPEAVMVIEDWQQDLRKVTMRIAWQDSESGETKSYEKPVFIHRDHLGE